MTSDRHGSLIRTRAASSGPFPMMVCLTVWLVSIVVCHRLAVPIQGAGISGPLIGADLLNLRPISTVSTGMLSIGGAGTFDGIVLSGLVAAFLA